MTFTLGGYSGHRFTRVAAKPALLRRPAAFQQGLQEHTEL